ncbi:chemotaxis protein [Hydrogenophilus thermoluteolus]|uniref:chemotaxis protein n=1 Tax=Hydrogenophilus thermoluteolus TaxID=297 RepID=UPI001C644700|nr:chemotaxis protein [Hydrogenophilus thermoluteolus]MBW7657043.1 chemotaxis protein [Hydrogenophilus thermoluteolus]GLW61394.1 chemotaxis protein CheV [Hydrogenophilus thermoluteolus]HNU19422.1 chemotaxis protein [Hydrogenophilus thermoluteolus]
MTDLLKRIDERTKLAGTNKLEILLFTLGVSQATGRRETFGINVFKVREVMKTPPITAAPEMPKAVKGMVSLRGVLVPVVDLGEYVGVEPGSERNIMIVTEYNQHVQGFLVESVDTILRLDWSQMRVPPDMLTAKMGGLVTAVTELTDGRLVMLLDVEKVLSDTTGGVEAEADLYAGIEPLPDADRFTIYYADDSAIAREQVERTLQKLGVRYVEAVNGRQCWENLERAAERARALKRPVKELVSAVLTDIEMPEMDGFILTKKIKTDRRFAGIPVLMHSSLSGMQNQHLGKSVGVDEYVPKFQPQELATILRRVLYEAHGKREG